MEEAEPETPEKWEEIQINGDSWGPKRGTGRGGGISGWRESCGAALEDEACDVTPGFVGRAPGKSSWGRRWTQKPD